MYHVNSNDNAAPLSLELLNDFLRLLTEYMLHLNPLSSLLQIMNTRFILWICHLKFLLRKGVLC